MLATVLLVLVVMLVGGGLVFGIITLVSGDDPGLGYVDPDRRARPLPNNRSLTETDLKTVRFDLAIRGYRMSQVDRVLRRTSYDLGYKDEMIAVLEAEVSALREGRREDADLLRKSREAANSPAVTTPAPVLDEPPAGTVIPPDEFSSLEETTCLPDEFTEPSDAGFVDEAGEPTLADDSDEPYDPALDTGPGRLAPRGFNNTLTVPAPDREGSAETGSESGRGAESDLHRGSDPSADSGPGEGVAELGEDSDSGSDYGSDPGLTDDGHDSDAGPDVRSGQGDANAGSDHRSGPELAAGSDPGPSPDDTPGPDDAQSGPEWGRAGQDGDWGRAHADDWGRGDPAAVADAGDVAASTAARADAVADPADLAAGSTVAVLSADDGDGASPNGKVTRGSSRAAGTGRAAGTSPKTRTGRKASNASASSDSPDGGERTESSDANASAADDSSLVNSTAADAELADDAETPSRSASTSRRSTAASRGSSTAASKPRPRRRG
jgi:DivIVA domain-containing protein